LATEAKDRREKTKNLVDAANMVGKISECTKQGETRKEKVHPYGPAILKQSRLGQDE
jgi:hypothetical protein